MSQPERSDVPRTPTTERAIYERNCALLDAMYDDGCIQTPRTDHMNHVLDALDKSGYAIEAQASRDAEATVAALREALNHKTNRHRGFETHCPECKAARQALTDSSSMAQAYRERLVAPWREALEELLDDWSVSNPDMKAFDAARTRARRLLDTPEGSER